MTNTFFTTLLNSVCASSSGQTPFLQGFLFGLYAFFCGLVFLVLIVAFRGVASASGRKG